MDQATSPSMATHLFIWHLFGQQSTLQLVLFKLNTLHKSRAIRPLKRVGRWGGEDRETEMQCKNALSLSLPDKRAVLFNTCSPPRHNDARMMSHCTLKVLLNTLRCANALSFFSQLPWSQEKFQLSSETALSFSKQFRNGFKHGRIM